MGSRAAVGWGRFVVIAGHGFEVGGDASWQKLAA
jgi:hypothetical protein